MRRIFCFIFGVCLIGFVSTPVSAEYLSADEIKRLLSGATVETTSITNNPMFHTFGADGSMRSKIEGDESEIEDDGKWWTRKAAKGHGKICWKLTSMYLGKKQCRALTLKNDGRTIRLLSLKAKRPRERWEIIKPGPGMPGN